VYSAVVYLHAEKVWESELLCRPSTQRQKKKKEHLLTTTTKANEERIVFLVIRTMNQKKKTSGRVIELYCTLCSAASQGISGDRGGETLLKHSFYPAFLYLSLASLSLLLVGSSSVHPSLISCHPCVLPVEGLHALKGFSAFGTT
jgi:hypothetical protein